MHASLSDIVADIAANSIEAGASNIRVSVVDENGTIELKVEDNGKGMPPEIVAKAFDPFYTEPGKHDKRKVGMGLPFVKQTCDACGVSVKLESRQGVGKLRRGFRPRLHPQEKRQRLRNLASRTHGRRRRLRFRRRAFARARVP